MLENHVEVHLGFLHLLARHVVLRLSAADVDVDADADGVEEQSWA